MEMNMFCYQCQETARGTGCTVRGVCGKTPEVSNLQDLLIYTLKGISEIVVKGDLNVRDLGTLNHDMLNSLFITITNANFDDDAIEKDIINLLC
jgi:hydroxylamine reductase